MKLTNIINKLEKLNIKYTRSTWSNGSIDFLVNNKNYSISISSNGLTIDSFYLEHSYDSDIQETRRTFFSTFKKMVLSF